MNNRPTTSGAIQALWLCVGVVFSVISVFNCRLEASVSDVRDIRIQGYNRGMAESDTTPVFKLNNSSDSFSAKSNDIFGCLSVIEKKHEAFQKAQPADENAGLVKPDPDDEEPRTVDRHRPERNRRRQDQSGQDFDHPQSRSRSEFTRPYPPPRFRSRGQGNRRTPDFKLNPNRWTKYTLDDVDGKDMTESSNTRAAFEFLEERRKLREMEQDPEAFKAANVEETACSKGAITFVRKKKDKSGVSVEKGKDILLPGDDGLDGDESGVVFSFRDGSDEKEDSAKEKVTFKSKKGRQRNIRSRPNDDDQDDQNG